jgi:solute carrier family 50 protein (sugar transporter)
MAENDIVGDIFGWAGTVICLYFFISPVVPFFKVLSGKLDYKDAPGVLLIMSFMNCVLWAIYGLVKNTFQVYFANGIGGSITLIFITIYFIYLGKRNLGIALLFNIGLLAVVFGLVLLFYFIVNPDVTGYVAMFFNILMYAAPGEKIAQVIKTQNFRLIPIFSTVGGFLCSLCWLMFGIYKNDWKLYVPNALGLVFAVLQITIYLIYYCKNKDKNISFPDENDDVV